MSDDFRVRERCPGCDLAFAVGPCLVDHIAHLRERSLARTLECGCGFRRRPVNGVALSDWSPAQCCSFPLHAGPSEFLVGFGRRPAVSSTNSHRGMP